MKHNTWLNLTFIICSFILIAATTVEAQSKPQLHYLIRQPKVKSRNPPLLILLHGLGSNERDLFSFASRLPSKYLVVSVRGPITLGADNYAWFSVDMSSGQRVINAKQAESSREAILQFINDLKYVVRFDTAHVSLMGFSQGALMSYSVGLTAPKRIERIVIMSSRLLPEIKPLIAPADQLAKLKVYIAHGTKDFMIPFQYALDAVSYLKSKGLNPDFHYYQTGHEINAQVLDDVITWLK